ncbi:IniB N-terminal domain-containing protein [Amycolatopsis palatopharyngis]|uniref:IniB N-terminal domain-containing protein n=1 Tax=Amycolatopsis palatopharyngis TaxID=187982 RepID=UPI000E25FDF3|nr:IniB N-terminal domain-containing protein [Amycolatopsis palatopharyngis]
MSLTDQTLHDFVLNLLTDESARSDFAADPAAALAGAGLGDVTAQDVQEVIPLVADFSDVAGAAPLSGLDVARADLPAELSADSAQGAIQQLQAVAEAGAVQGAPELGEFTYAGGGSADGVAGTFGYTSEQLSGASAFTASSEGVAGIGGFDSDLGNGTLVGEGNLTDGATLGGSLGNDEFSREAAVSVGPDGVSFDHGEGTGLGAFDFAGSGDAEGVSGGGTFANDEFVGAGTLSAGVDGVTSEFASDSALGEFAGFSAGSAEGVAGGAAFAGEHMSFEGSGAGNQQEFALGGSTDSLLGDYGLETAGQPATAGLGEAGAVTERSDALDADALGKVEEAAGGTLATYVSSGGNAFAGSLPAMGAVPAAPELPAELPTELPEAGLPADLPVDVPATPELPAELPEAGLPANVPAEVPATPELPEAELPTDLPVDLPELPVANPLPDAGEMRGDFEQGVSESPLGDVVSESPLGELPGATGDAPSGSASGDASGDLQIG